MKLPPWWRKAAIGLLILLVLSHPISLPLALFLALILFITSDSGKKYFDLDQWDTKSPPVQKKEQSKEAKKEDITIISPPPKKKKNNNQSSFFHSFTQKKTMNINLQQKPQAPFSGGLIGIALIAFVAVSIISDGIVSIPAGHTGVIFSRVNGGIQDSTLNEGFNFKLPFLETATIIDTRIQEKTINQQRDPIQALTKDGQKVNIDITVQYRISRESAPNLLQEIGMEYENKVITPGVRSVVREVITGYDSTELFQQEARTKAEEEIVSQLQNNYEKKYIKLEDALIRDVKFSDKYLDAIEEKKIAEQQIQKSEFERQNAEVQKEKKIIEAQAEAESIKLKGEALSSSPEVIQLQFVEKMAPSINWGILPDGAIPMINTESLTK